MRGAPTVSDVRAAFAPPAADEPSRKDAPPGVSAVLAAAYEGEDGDAWLVYTRRASTLRQHAGEISFPGGRVDAADKDPLAAALREAEEEIGLAPSQVAVLGHLTDFLTFRDVLVCAYVGVVRGDAVPREPRSRDEVEEVLLVPVAHLLDAARYRSLRVEGVGHDRRIHYWRLDQGVLWGITGELTARLLERVWGWAPPTDARLIEDLAELDPLQVFHE